MHTLYTEYCMYEFLEFLNELDYWKQFRSYTRLHEGSRLFQDIPLSEGETISSPYGKLNDANLARPLVYSRERTKEN